MLPGSEGQVRFSFTESTCAGEGGQLTPHTPMEPFAHTQTLTDNASKDTRANRERCTQMHMHRHTAIHTNSGTHCHSHTCLNTDTETHSHTETRGIHDRPHTQACTRFPSSREHARIHTQKQRHTCMVTGTHTQTKRHPAPPRGREEPALLKALFRGSRLHPAQTGASESCMPLCPCVFSTLPWPGVTRSGNIPPRSCVRLRKIPHFGVRLVCVL